MSAVLRATTVAVTALVTLTLLVVPPAAAHHDHWCVDYTDPANSTQQEYIAEGAQIPFEIVHLALSIKKDALENAIDVNPEPVSKAAMVATKKVVTGFMVAMTSVIGVLKLTRFGLSVVNTHADGCRFDEHWLGTDDLLTAAVRKDLAATTPPLAQLVLPSEAGGLLDETGVGVHDVVVRTIQDLEPKGLCPYCATARSYLDRATAAREAGRFKEAYSYYRRAYVTAAR